MARPKRLRAPHGALVLEIDWEDGRTVRYPHWLLRGLCPCAGCQGHGGGIRYIEGTEHNPAASLRLERLEQVGNYALSLQFGDGHGSGIYTFTYLEQLAAVVDSPPAELAGRTFGG